VYPAALRLARRERPSSAANAAQVAAEKASRGSLGRVPPTTKEDLVYNRLLQRDPASADEILDLLTDHARLGALTRRFAAALRNVAHDVELPRDLFEGVAREYLEETRRHMELEETEFFPRALLRLESEDWAEIEAAIASPEDPLFSDRLADEYRKLHQLILELIE
jgi:hemerythrin-like domain-containing protein